MPIGSIRWAILIGNPTNPQMYNQVSPNTENWQNLPSCTAIQQAQNSHWITNNLHVNHSGTDVSAINVSRPTPAYSDVSSASDLDNSEIHNPTGQNKTASVSIHKSRWCNI